MSNGLGSLASIGRCPSILNPLLNLEDAMKIRIEAHEFDPLIKGLQTTINESKKLIKEKKVKRLQKVKEKIEKKLSE